uniref:Shootin-1 n=1 Tax=Astyanax mexicanus TaxID=7994 RepID=W5KWK7_ASTMX
LRQYEVLRKEHEKTKLECKQLKKERDEAQKKLEEFERSHRVLQEVNSMQENLEVEKTCRETVEALASKLNRQNRSLKRKSMLYLAHLGADVIADIKLDDDEEDEDEQAAEPGICSSAHCNLIITLRSKLKSAQEEKKRLTIDLDSVKDQLRKTKEELLREKHDNTVLIAETLQQKKLLGKYNRMLVEQKKLKRQSKALMHNISPSEALQNALKEITSLTHKLETQRLEHQQQSLLSMLRKKKDTNNDIPMVEKDSPAKEPKDIRQQAVSEMMERIKKGIQLRPVGHSSNRQRERIGSSSAIQELKGILSSVLDLTRVKHTPTGPGLSTNHQA